MRRSKRMNSRTVICGFVMSILIISVSSCALNRGSNTKPTTSNIKRLFGFETDQELAEIKTDNGPGDKGRDFPVESSSEHATEGRYSLKVVYPDQGDGPEIVFDRFHRDWSAYNYLKVDVYNPSRAVVRLNFFAVDREPHAGENPNTQRFFWSDHLKPGKNTYTIEIKDAKLLDDIEFVNLKLIKRIGFTLVERPKGLILYFDNMRLEE